jgi:hypothetical protein
LAFPSCKQQPIAVVGASNVEGAGQPEPAANPNDVGGAGQPEPAANPNDVEGAGQPEPAANPNDVEGAGQPEPAAVPLLMGVVQQRLLFLFFFEFSATTPVWDNLTFLNFRPLRLFGANSLF